MIFFKLRENRKKSVEGSVKLKIKFLAPKYRFRYVPVFESEMSKFLPFVTDKGLEDKTVDKVVELVSDCDVDVVAVEIVIFVVDTPH